MSKSITTGVFSAFTLKVFACVFMLFDHIGLMLLPQFHVLRVIGRISYPLFAYFIAEGCRYTKNKLRRFLSIFLLGVVCELAYILFTGSYYGNILLTFSISVLLIYLLSTVKKSFSKSTSYGILMATCFALSLICVYFYCEFIGLDYGFFGVVTPISVVLFDDMGRFSEKLYGMMQRQVVTISVFAFFLVLLCFSHNTPDYQFFCLLSLPLLMLYNGERGKYSFKYGFYVFYPLHILLLQGISALM